MRELRPLQLPQMVEARKREETPMSSPISAVSQASDLPSPSTPTFSLRGHARFPSSTSSLASSPTVRDSMDGFGSAKRPLTEVKEEPPEKDDDYEMVDSSEVEFDNDRALSTSVSYSESSMTAETYMTSSSPEYDLADGASDLEFAMNPVVKRPRPSDFSSNGFTSRLGTRFPSLSHKWRNKRANNTTSIIDGMQEMRQSRSRANSTRAPSLAGSETPDPKDQPLPPTPARSVFDDPEEDMLTSIDIQKANAPKEDTENKMKATTPLLPPLLANISTHLQDVPYQSPLQSPTVAEIDSPSGTHTPLNSPLLPSLPSPPLSTKPSFSSIHRGRGFSQLPSPSALLPYSEIPPLPLPPTSLALAAQDPWSDALGHANFTISPEPYRPETFTPSTYKEMRKDWDLARQNYTRHLARVGEHYGATSKIYRLTEVKWAEIDNQWRDNSEFCLAQTVDTHGLSTPLWRETPAPLIKLPSLNGPRSEGKFPRLGDEVIVGPMEQVASLLNQPKRSGKKRSFLKFLQGMLPSDGGIFSRRERSPS